MIAGRTGLSLVVAISILTLLLVVSCAPAAQPTPTQPAAPTAAQKPVAPTQAAPTAAQPAASPTQAAAPAATQQVAGATATQMAAPAAAQLPDPIIIAATVHLTGPVATYDFPPVEGARLAVSEINASGGVLGSQLRLIELDGQSDPAKVGDAAIAAVDQGAVVLIAPCDFDYGSPVSRVAQDQGLVGISECAGSPQYSSTVLGDMQFTMSPWANYSAAGSAEHALQQGWTRGVVIVDDFIDFTKSLAEYWKDAFQQGGGEIVLEIPYHKGDMTFAAQTQRIMQLGPDAFDVVLLAEDQPDAALIVRTLRAAGITAPVVGSVNLDSRQFYDALGEAAGNDIFVASPFFVTPDAGPEMAQFIEAFRQQYNKEPEGLNVPGYDLIYVVAQAIEKAGSVDGPALARAMENTQFEILAGTMEWSDAASGHVPKKPLGITVEQQGNISFGGLVEPSYVPPVQ